jgi:hypothetical protein
LAAGGRLPETRRFVNLVRMSDAIRFKIRLLSSPVLAVAWLTHALLIC